jgi:hypothetical protein
MFEFGSRKVHLSVSLTPLQIRLCGVGIGPKKSKKYDRFAACNENTLAQKVVSEVIVEKFRLKKYCDINPLKIKWKRSERKKALKSTLVTVSRGRLGQIDVSTICKTSPREREDVADEIST